MKYATYCPECFKYGLNSELKQKDPKIICTQCGWVVN